MTTVGGMVLVPGGEFWMGSADFYPEESPVRAARVATLWVDEHVVTNLEFGRFVLASGYVTVAERSPQMAALTMARPGSLVFSPTPGPVPLDDWRRWWRWVEGASWRHPEGPGSSFEGREDHPVVHVGLEDAVAYAHWAGKRLPTETEWEHAARGGLDGCTYSWGDEFMPNRRVMANTWHGRFPFENLSPHGFTRTSPVGSFPPNGYHLYDMTGNVWEWTSSRWALPVGGALLAASGGEGDELGPTGDDWPATAATSTAVRAPDDRGQRSPVAKCCAGRDSACEEEDRFVIKGGSHLCASSYCHRYRPAAREGQGVNDTTGHLGFRCVRDV